MPRLLSCLGSVSLKVYSDNRGERTTIVTFLRSSWYFVQFRQQPANGGEIHAPPDADNQDKSRGLKR